MPEPQSPIGRRISHYRVLEKLGGGGTGVVYKAEDTELGRFVALKFLPEDVARDRIARTFPPRSSRCFRLNHPNICTIYEIGQQDGSLHCHGISGSMTLKHRISGRPLEMELLLDLGSRLPTRWTPRTPRASFIATIKPANLFISDRGHAKILDFGLAKQF